MEAFKYALSSADAAPATAPILLQGTVCENLRAAAKLGYSAIEVHTREDAPLPYEEIAATAEACGVGVAMVVTGRLNTEGGLSLLDESPHAAAAALEGMRRYANMAQRLGAGLVVGWVRGNIPPGGSAAKYLARLAETLRQVCLYAQSKGVPVNLEVINRYEVNTLNTAAETLAFLQQHDIPNCFIHLDTFHMGIEEADPVAAIELCRGRLGYFHVADNTRGYPGSGQFNFAALLNALRRTGYTGYVSVECLPKPTAATAAKQAIQHLRAL